ncbi:MAG: hypothetical protein U0237_14890 [Thermoleophilia bacterium]
MLDDGTTLDPVEEVARQAERVLGEDLAAYRSSAQDADGPVPRGTDLSFVPEAPGIEFNPPSRTFAWMEPVHREEFRMRAGAALAGTTVRGRLSVYCGGVLIAGAARSPRRRRRRGRPHRTVERPQVSGACSPPTRTGTRRWCAGVEAVFDFPRHPHLPARQAGVAGRGGLGRPPEGDDPTRRWHAALMWWRYALSLGRPKFVRPVYWEEPFPEDRRRAFPEDLRRLHFQRASPGRTGLRPPCRTPARRPAADPGHGRVRRSSGASLAAVAAVVAGASSWAAGSGVTAPGATPRDALIAFLPPLVASGCAPRWVPTRRRPARPRR